jgi:hypothetical protein
MKLPLIKQLLIPIIALLAINYLFFYPVFQGKVLEQDDMIQGALINRQVDEFYEKDGTVLLWTDVLFSGMPAVQVAMRYPNNFITYIQKSLNFLLGKPSNIYIIALLMLGFFLTLYSLKVDPWLAFAGAVAFGFSTFFIVSFGAGHNAKVRTAAYIAPLLAGILLTYRGKKWLGWSITALVMGLSIFSNHLQITYYSMFIVFYLVATEFGFAVKNKEFKNWMIASAGLLLAAIIGIGPNVSRLTTNYDYAKETMRGGISELTVKQEKSSGGLDYDYAMSWSYGKFETLNLFFTNITGGGSNQNYEGTATHDFYFKQMKSGIMQQGTSAKQAEIQANRSIASLFYWGDQTMVGGGYYLGAVVFFLFILSMLILPFKERTWIILALLFTMLIAWGKNLEGFSTYMFENFPLYNKFRVPSMALVVWFVLIPLSGWLALNQIYKMEMDKKKALNAIKQAFFITGGLSLFLIIIAGGIDVSGPKDDYFRQQGLNIDMLLEDRISLIRSSAFKTLMFCLLTASLLYGYVKGFIQSKYFPIILVVLIGIDQLPFVRQHLSLDKFVTQAEYDRAFAASGPDKAIKAAESDVHYRVLNLTRSLTGDAFTSHHHSSLGGYHGAKLARYQDLIDHQLEKRNRPAINMLNTKWFIGPDQKTNQLMAIPNAGACGNGWFAQNITWVENADEEIEALTDFEACSEVIIDERYKSYMEGVQMSNANSTVSISHYNPMHIEYEVINNNDSPSLIVLSEIYYEGGGKDWISLVDGQEVDHIRVNYLLRGIKVPPGTHKVEFKFEPPSFYKGEQYALFFSIIFFGFIGFGLFKHFK